jgi:lipoyl-dependent peroxiredoxin
MAIRTGTAEWKGSLAGGNGTFSGESGQLEGTYTAQSRFEEGVGSNPEELIAAAHAGCFSMAFSGILSEGGNVPESIRTQAKVQIVKDGDGFAVNRIDLVTVARVPGVDEAAFQEAAKAAKAGCPISKALAAVPEINLDATLES